MLLAFPSRVCVCVCAQFFSMLLHLSLSLIRLLSVISVIAVAGLSHRVVVGAVVSINVVMMIPIEYVAVFIGVAVLLLLVFLAG